MTKIKWKSPLTLLECHNRLSEAAVMLQTLADYGPAQRRRFGPARRFAADSLAVLTRMSNRPNAGREALTVSAEENA